MSVHGPTNPAQDDSGPGQVVAKVNERVLLYATGVGVALVVAFAFRALVDGGQYPFSLRATTLDALQALPLGVGSVLVAAAVLGRLSDSPRLSRIDALATSALAVALQQPYAAVTGGRPFPVVMIPVEVALIATTLAIVDRVYALA
jgi:hypothetical protein